MLENTKEYSYSISDNFLVKGIYMIQPNKNPENYDNKFASFIALCEKAKQDNIPSVIISHPHVLGDNYDEIIESLTRLAKAGLSLQITLR